MTKKVFVTDYTLADEMDIEQQMLEEIDAELVRAQCSTEEEVLAQIGSPDAIITQWAPVTRRVLEKANGCRVVSRNGIGVDNIDLAACKDLGIAVTNIPGYCIPEVADHAMALALACLRKLQPVVDSVRAGEWGEGPMKPTRRLETLTFGVLGLGRIGRAVANRARPFFAEVIGFDAYAKGEVAEVTRRVESAEALFSEADIISIHIPGTAETAKMVNSHLLGLMRPGSHIVNTCRGIVVDTDAVVAALGSGQLGGCGLDVHDPEPLPQDHPLRGFPNAILTPHVAYYSEESVLEARRQTVENIVLFFQGKDPISRLV